VTTKHRHAAGGQPDRPRPEPDSSPPASPSHDEIARRAYELFLERGSAEGRSEEDWLRAEDELRRK
jgi:hypothetical protein